MQYLKSHFIKQLGCIVGLLIFGCLVFLAAKNIGLFGINQSNNPQQTPTPTITTELTKPISADAIFTLVNEERQKAGLKPLVRDPRLDQSAMLKAKDMLDKDYFAHTSPTKVSPWYWIKKEKYFPYCVTGENLAIDYITDEDVVSGWMASKEHKENILWRGYVDTGVAVLPRTNSWGIVTDTIVVQHFGSQKWPCGQ
jgi:uncharacterized protein YkwD